MLDLLATAGFTCIEDAQRGFDHGVFVPLVLMYPDAEIPVVMLSMKSGYDPLEHIHVGEGHATLRNDRVLFIGSGLTYYYMRGFSLSESYKPSLQFEDCLKTGDF